jgi:S-adenosylmethionine-diacylglycerol 3-amino-3-carboxypropyl transferase
MYVAGARDSIEALCNVRSLDDQRNLYYTHVHPILWKGYIRWLLRRDTTLSLLGVPRPQRDQIERSYAGGIVQFIKDCVEAVFTHFPLWGNYFWQVYLRGAYTPECCPEYLKRDNFERLKAGLADRISLYTGSLTGFLVTQKPAISRVILLDHMDWLSVFDTAALQREWQALVDQALPGARFLWRSGGLHVHYVDPIQVTAGKWRYRVGELLAYHRELAADLHRQDRVHTYGSFYIADLQTA